MTPTMETRYAYAITAHNSAPAAAGDVGCGARRIIPTIGKLRGERVNRPALPVATNYQLVRPNELVELEVRYALKTADGATIYIENKGTRFGRRELLERLKWSEAVDPKLIYCHPVPEFETGTEKRPLADGAHFCRLRRPPAPTVSLSTCFRVRSLANVAPLRAR